MDFLRGLDERVFVLLNSTFSHPWLDAFFPRMTDLHKHPAFFLVLLPLFGFALWRRYAGRGLWLMLAFVISCGLTDVITAKGLKNVIERPRPPDTAGLTVVQRCPAGGHSFPSSHATNMFSAATFLSSFMPGWGSVLYPLAALTGYSRVYCGVHFPGDVLAGALWGIFLGFLFSRVARRVILRKNG